MGLDCLGRILGITSARGQEAGDNKLGRAVRHQEVFQLWLRSRKIGKTGRVRGGWSSGLAVFRPVVNWTRDVTDPAQMRWLHRVPRPMRWDERELRTWDPSSMYFYAGDLGLAPAAAFSSTKEHASTPRRFAGLADY